MSEPYPNSYAEIGDEEKNALVARLREIFPQPTLEQGVVDDEHVALLASVLGRPEEEIKLELEIRGEFGKKIEYLTASGRHALNEDFINLDWTSYDESKWEAKVAIYSTAISTNEGVRVDGLTTYYIKPASAQMRSKTFLFKKADFVNEEELRSIFAEEYLAPILDKYKNLSSMDGTKPVDQTEYWRLMAKLDRLGPDTIAYQPF